jgi:hypothetical protein
MVFARDRPIVFDAPGFDEDIERRERILLGLGHPDVLQRSLGFRLLTLQLFVEHVGGLVHPAALAAGLGPYFLDRLPKPERAVGDRELRPDRKPASPQVEREILPGLRTPAHAINQPDELLLAFRRGANDDELALRSVLEPGLDMNAVGPEVLWVHNADHGTSGPVGINMVIPVALGLVIA